MSERTRLFEFQNAGLVQGPLSKYSSNLNLIFSRDHSICCKREPGHGERCTCFASSGGNKLANVSAYTLSILVPFGARTLSKLPFNPSRGGELSR